MPAGDWPLTEIMESYERDREFIALELHDNVLQTLASAGHYIQAAYRVVSQDRGGGDQVRDSLLRALGLLRQSIAAARALTGDLKPPVLDRFGLAQALTFDLEELRQETGWQVTFQRDALEVPREMELPLYRILREAITNARKHSLSRSLGVRLRYQASPPMLLAEVRDEGQGFDPDSVRRRGVGLLSMQMRARALGGECRIESAPGAGTTVTVRLPLPGLCPP